MLPSELANLRLGQEDSIPNWVQHKTLHSKKLAVILGVPLKSLTVYCREAIELEDETDMMVKPYGYLNLGANYKGDLVGLMMGVGNGMSRGWVTTKKGIAKDIAWKLAEEFITPELWVPADVAWHLQAIDGDLGRDKTLRLLTLLDMTNDERVRAILANLAYSLGGGLQGFDYKSASKVAIPMEVKFKLRLL